MATGKGKILIVDDNEDVLLALNMLLKPHVEAVRVLTRPERLGEFMDSFTPDVIILDMNFSRDVISGEEGYYWLRRILEKDPKAVVLFITAYVDTEKAVRAIKAGAVDFIPKPWDNAKMLGVVQSAIQLSFSRKMQADMVSGTSDAMPDMIGESPQMTILKKQIAKVGFTDANVLIVGENGTGKDVTAHLLHKYSRRADMPFVTVDLGTVPDQLFESELFGYEKGAFTDAKSAKAGRVETANNGTLFLDEIGNLNIQAQQKLLTLIEKHEYSRLGSTKPHKADVRIIAATNADLADMVAKGTFRQDLYYRINTIEIHVPPLRDRGNDIILLADFFTSKIARQYRMPVPRLSRNLMDKLLRHQWSGNVRELQHVIERAVVLATGDILDADDVMFPKAYTKSHDEGETLNLGVLEKEAIIKALERSDGNLSQAAELLGITRFALYRKIEKLKL